MTGSNNSGGNTGGYISSAIEASSVRRNLNLRTCVVVERVARGGGSTHWYFISSVEQLSSLAGRLLPGSVVSFYFDGRIQQQLLDDSLVDAVLNLVVEHGEAVVGALASDGLTIDVEYIAGLGDFTEFLGPSAGGRELFIGAFPGRDDDGYDAVTLTLPDADGVVRCHPH